MTQMKLKLNEDKTEYIQFGFRTQLKKCDDVPLDANSSLVQKSKTVKYLGVDLDSHSVNILPRSAE